MKKKSILIVGFGSIGCRHAQSFLDKKKEYDLHIVEPSDKNIEQNIIRINAIKSNFKWYKNIKDAPITDIAIVATPSSPRFKIVKNLIMMGYKKFLLEKIVFQSENQFKTILKMMKKNNCIAYCNFVNRYFIAYNKIKKKLEKSNTKININVNGGAFGLGCNAIHYVDLLQYLTKNNNIELKNSQLQLLDNGNPRGSNYSEFFGLLELATDDGDTISIKSEINKVRDQTISISQGLRTFFLNENTGKFKYDNKSVKGEDDFNIIPSSELTSTIVNDILNNDCRLTQINQTMLSHSMLFKAFNNALNNFHSPSTLCPIT